MSWQPEVDEIKRRRAFVEQMGGPEGIARQHQNGKLTVRERIDLLADPGSFREFAGLMGKGTYDDDGLVGLTPRGLVEGMCSIDGRKVVLSGGDFTVRAGSGGGSHGELGREMSAARRAREWRLPFVRLLDAAGGSVRHFEEIGRTYLPDANAWTTVEIDLLGLVPCVSLVLGSVAGGPAVDACLAHWNVMVEGTSHLFPGGPPVVKAAFGTDVTKAELGGSHIHVGVSGVIDNLATTEQDALDQARRFLSYLPSNVDQQPPRLVIDDPPDRRAEELLSLIPRNRRRPFDARRLIDLVVDRGSFFEIAPRYGGGRITGLARVDGYPIGVMANDPSAGGGSTDVAAGEKAIRLIQLCDTFHLPLVSFADEPGFMVGIESEVQGIERAGARIMWAVCKSRMPWITFVVGRLFGVGGQCHHRPTGMFQRYAWPSARWGSMHIQGGASAAYRRDIETAADPEAARREIEARLEALASPFRTAEATGQDIIDPRDTRALLAEFVHDAQPVLATQLGPSPVPYRP
jgi:acetyl-CoA carboxylase carboxyltransferase component